MTFARNVDILRYVLECSARGGCKPPCPITLSHEFIQRSLQLRAMSDIRVLLASQRNADALFSAVQAQRAWPVFTAILDCLIHVQQLTKVQRRMVPPPLDDGESVGQLFGAEESLAVRVIDALSEIMTHTSPSHPELDDRQISHINLAMCLSLSYLFAHQVAVSGPLRDEEFWTIPASCMDGTRSFSFHWPLTRAACLFVRTLLRAEASGNPAAAAAASTALRGVLASSDASNITRFDPPGGWQWQPPGDQTQPHVPTQTPLSCQQVWRQAALPLLNLQCGVSQMARGMWPYNSTSTTYFARLYKLGWARARELDAICLFSWMACSAPGTALCQWLCAFADVHSLLKPVFGITGSDGSDPASCPAAAELALSRPAVAIRHSPLCSVLAHGGSQDKQAAEARQSAARRHGLCDALTGLLMLFRNVGISTMPLRERVRHCVVQCLAGSDMGHGQLCEVVSLIHFEEEKESVDILDSVLEEVATIRMADARRSATYLLKRDAWKLLDPYYLHFTQVERAVHRAEDLGVGSYASTSLPPVNFPDSLHGALAVLSSPVTVRVIIVLLATCAASPSVCSPFALPLLHLLIMCIHHWQVPVQPSSPQHHNWHALPEATQAQLRAMLCSEPGGDSAFSPGAAEEARGPRAVVKRLTKSLDFIRGAGSQLAREALHSSGFGGRRSGGLWLQSRAAEASSGTPRDGAASSSRPSDGQQDAGGHRSDDIGALVSLKAMAQDEGVALALGSDVQKCAAHALDMLSAFLAAHPEGDAAAPALPSQQPQQQHTPPGATSPAARGTVVADQGAPSPTPDRSTSQASLVSNKKAAMLAAMQAQQAAFLASLGDDESSDDDKDSADMDAQELPAPSTTTSPAATATAAAAQPRSSHAHDESMDCVDDQPAANGAEPGPASKAHDVRGGGSSRAQEAQLRQGVGVQQASVAEFRAEQEGCRFFARAADCGDDVCCLCHAGSSADESLGPLCCCSLITPSSALLMVPKDATSLSSAIDSSQGLVVLSCGHKMHATCHATHVSKLRQVAHTRDEDLLDIYDRLQHSACEYLCPMCRRLCNALFPATSSTTTAPSIRSVPASSTALSEHPDHPRTPGDVLADLVAAEEAVARWKDVDTGLRTWLKDVHREGQATHLMHTNTLQRVWNCIGTSRSQQLTLSPPGVWKSSPAGAEMVDSYNRWQAAHTQAAQALQGRMHALPAEELNLLSSTTAMACVAHWEATYLRPPARCPSFIGSDASTSSLEGGFAAASTSGGAAAEGGNAPMWLVRAQWRGLQSAVAMLVTTACVHTLTDDEAGSHWDAIERRCSHCPAALRRVLAELHDVANGADADRDKVTQRPLAPSAAAETDKNGASERDAGPSGAAVGSLDSCGTRIQAFQIRLSLGKLFTYLVPAPPLAGLLLTQMPLSSATPLPAALLGDHVDMVGESAMTPLSPTNDALALAFALLPHLLLCELLRFRAETHFTPPAAASSVTQPCMALPHAHLQKAVRDAAALVWPIAVVQAAQATARATLSANNNTPHSPASTADSVWAHVYAAVTGAAQEHTSAATRSSSGLQLQGAAADALRGLELGVLSRVRTVIVRLYLLHELVGCDEAGPMLWESAGDVFPRAMSALQLPSVRSTLAATYTTQQPSASMTQGWLVKDPESRGFSAANPPENAMSAPPAAAAAAGSAPVTDSPSSAGGVDDGGAVAMDSVGVIQQLAAVDAELPMPLRPALPAMPQTYHDLFLPLSTQRCYRCGCVPIRPLLCLLTHRVLCTFDEKCTTLHAEGGPARSHGERRPAMVHTTQVCGRCGVFIDLKSSSVIAVCGPRTSQLPGFYLDAHGEEDTGLTRGKALKFSSIRFRQLERLWVSAALSFDTSFYEQSAFFGRRF